MNITAAKPKASPADERLSVKLIYTCVMYIIIQLYTVVENRLPWIFERVGDKCKR